MGPVVEAPVIKAMSAVDYSQRLTGEEFEFLRKACEILVKVGTRESLAILNTLKTATSAKSKSPHNQLNNLAISAIESIEERAAATKGEKEAGK